MKRTLLECMQKTLTVILSVSSTMGMFLMGVFTVRIFLDPVPERILWMIVLISFALTYGFTKLLTLIKWELYNLLVDELEFHEDKQAEKLYDHLKVR